MKFPNVIFFLTALFLIASCIPAAEFDIRGGWDYTMTDTNGSIYDDGSITFSGKLAGGTYLEINIYQVEYEGEFSVDGSTIKLTGDENWDGMIIDGNTINGTWSHEDGFSGTFIAIRKKNP